MALKNLRIKESRDYSFFYKAAVVMFLCAVFFAAGMEAGERRGKDKHDVVPIFTAQEAIELINRKERE